MVVDGDIQRQGLRVPWRCAKAGSDVWQRKASQPKETLQLLGRPQLLRKKIWVAPRSGSDCEIFNLKFLLTGR